MNWYYAKENQPVGPLSDVDFQQAVNVGAVTPETMVWNEGMTGWAPFSTVSGAADPTAPQPPPAPVAVPDPTTGACSECAQLFKYEDMISYEGRNICAGCKPAFFQRLQEGAANAGRTPNRELMTRARASLKEAWWFSFGAMFVLGLIKGIAGSLPYCIGFVIQTILGGAFELGNVSFLLNLARKGKTGVRFGMIFDGFSFFGQALVQYLVVFLMMSMWSSPALITGIGCAIAFAYKQMALGAILALLTVGLFSLPVIYGYAYAMTYFVLYDNKTMGPFVVLNRSSKMMAGRKMKLFFLQLRFIGWALLTVAPVLIAAIPLAVAWIKDNNLPDSNPAYFFSTLGLLIIVGLACALCMSFVNIYIQVSTAHFYDDVKDRALDLQA